jgi:hypothetical protein
MANGAKAGSCLAYKQVAACVNAEVFCAIFSEDVAATI